MSWVDDDPKSWSTIVAAYDQDCPDACGGRIEIGQTTITRVTGTWRRYDCVLRQWQSYRDGERRGTQGDLTAAIRRVTADRVGYVIVRGFIPDGPRDGRYVWIEVSYDGREKSG